MLGCLGGANEKPDRVQLHRPPEVDPVMHLRQLLLQLGKQMGHREFRRPVRDQADRRRADVVQDQHGRGGKVVIRQLSLRRNHDGRQGRLLNSPHRGHEQKRHERL
jgi:hypothetical protein